MVSSAAELGLAEGTDLHRPFIDTVTLECVKCQGVMKRVPEVLDTWFDSGSMPFAQRGYPRKGKELFEQTFPADFISEAIDQTRGWFYTLLAISTLLFKQNSYRNVVCLGHVVDPTGKKASKSRGNVLDPNYLFSTFGSDAVRWYFYTSTQVGENYRTGDAALRETVQQFFIPLWNCFSFFVTYALLAVRGGRDLSHPRGWVVCVPGGFARARRGRRRSGGSRHGAGAPGGRGGSGGARCRPAQGPPAARFDRAARRSSARGHRRHRPRRAERQERDLWRTRGPARHADHRGPQARRP